MNTTIMTQTYSRVLREYQGLPYLLHLLAVLVQDPDEDPQVEGHVLVVTCAVASNSRYTNTQVSDDSLSPCRPLHQL